VEKRVGFLGIKSTPDHFYVQRNSFTSANFRIIPFEVELLNEGRAMNLYTGVFRAPVNGIYYFSFRGFPSRELMSLHPVFAYLRVNGITKATSTSSTASGVTVSLECTLKLKKGDNVDMKKGQNGVFEDNSSEHLLTHFSGFLLEEDLAIF